jgi:hypothetical protein
MHQPSCVEFPNRTDRAAPRLRSVRRCFWIAFRSSRVGWDEPRDVLP